MITMSVCGLESQTDKPKFTTNVKKLKSDTAGVQQRILGQEMEHAEVLWRKNSL